MSFYARENSNRLTKVADTEYQYDNNGNIINDGEHTYTYDARNRLVSIDNGTTASYLYNANNMQVKKTTVNETTNYGWDNDRIFAEYDASGNPIQETVYFGSTPIALLKDGNTYRIFADQIDTPRVITDNTNKTLWAWDSKPFGENKPNEDVDGDNSKLSYNLRFPGQYYDAETGKHYNFNRDYDPVTGRYVQSDPIGLDGGMNGYGYVILNPIIKTDPFGLLPNDFYAAEEISTLEFNGYNVPFIDVCYGCNPLGPFDEGVYDSSNNTIVINAVHLGNYNSMWNDVLSDKDAKILLSVYFHELIHANQGRFASFLLSNFDSRTGRFWIGNALHQRIEEHAKNLANYYHEYYNSLRQQPLSFEYFTNNGAYPCGGEYPCQFY